MVIDCFPFFNELDILEIRLNSLVPYVNKFILVESERTHSNKSKPLYFQESKKRFKQFNITHLVSDLPVDKSPWSLEKHQREYLMNGIKDANLDDTVLLSDIDEIPDLSNFEEGMEGVFRQKLYYYALNCFTGKNNWKGTISILKKNIKTLNELRDNRNKINSLPCNGWHFSTIGSTNRILEKIESFAHQELNTNEIKKNIMNNRNNLKDPYNRTNISLIIEMPNGPEWLLQNKERYKNLWLS